MERDTIADLHVAIVGAGIGGLALAMALHKKNVRFTLYEEAKQYSAVGAGIGLGPNGLRALDLIEPGCRELYEKACVGNKPEDAQNVFFEGMLLEEGLGKGEKWFGQSSWGHPDFTRKSAHRKELLDIMTSFIPIDNVKFSKSLVNISKQEHKVELTFADGEMASASVLLGSDGVKSIVRAYVLAPSHPHQVAPVYADAYCYRAVIPMSEAEEILGDLTDVAKFYFGDKRSAVTYRISGGEEFNFLLCIADDNGWKSIDAVTEKVTHEVMMSDFENRGIDQRFLRLLAKAPPIRWGLFHHLHTSTYTSERVALLGDSAHASLPFQAAGAAQGVEDALILSNLLATISSTIDKGAPADPYIRAALHAYDSVRRPRAQKQLEQSAELGRMMFFQDPETGSDMYKILPLLQQGRFEWLWFLDMDAEWMMDTTMPANVESYTHFLRRDSLYDEVKPYSLRYTAPDGFPRANILLDRHNISIRDVRTQKQHLSLEENGCFIWDFTTSLGYSKFDDESAIKGVYLPEVSRALCQLLGAAKVQIFEHTVRKRHCDFPISTGEPYDFNQPTSIAHVDTTIQWCHAMAQQLNPEDTNITKGRIQCINVWKPLRGPVEDWPLALCEPSTIQAASDLEPCDLVYPDYVVENRQVYHSPEQKWFYLGEQREDEAWVFLQTDTERTAWTVAHTSFPMPNAPSGVLPRESIEARALVYYYNSNGAST
ncbi:hypothetical protein LTR62_000922 [Meristemomyces frigidus]|uniref:FAD-binding domain-containing protein n=1 Tax=Meristemomyces frigidus TaxID=1508187 RepID=A0AAN7TK66_9PEZI|nr:hypothetical protein LTR62_000922 [Meristemomyces frigidus]